MADETDMSLEELLDRYERGESAEIVPPLIALLRNIDRKLGALLEIERAKPMTIQIHYPEPQPIFPSPMWPFVNTSTTEAVGVRWDGR